MKLYIAGKITGDLRYKAKFRDEKKRLESLGHKVINPAELPEGLRPQDYVRLCFALIDSSDAIALMPDHLDSKGALLERDYCRYIGKPIYLLTNTGEG